MTHDEEAEWVRRCESGKLFVTDTPLTTRLCSAFYCTTPANDVGDHLCDLHQQLNNKELERFVEESAATD